jgi:phospholipid N-methyltransferase
VTYLREFITSPAMVGALAPSSRVLAQAIVQDAAVGAADVVLEYGPGTGVFTEFILRELAPGARFAAIELNSSFARTFRSRYPGVTLFEDSVANVHTLCRAAGFRSVDCIVSGLPWIMFPERLQVQCLDEMMRVLEPGARFVTFSYVHSQPILAGAKRFSRLLPAYFKTVSRSPIVWRNFPPAFIYRCVR